MRRTLAIKGQHRLLLLLAFLGLFCLYIVVYFSQLTKQFLRPELSVNETIAIQKAVAAVGSLASLKELVNPNEALYQYEEETNIQETKVSASIISSSSGNASQPTNFIHRSQLDYVDMFSATSWQSIDSFLEVNLTNIGDVEGASFHQFYLREERVKMTTNFLDLSVEHLSKWWQVVYNRGGNKDWSDYPGRYELVVNGLKSFVEAHMSATRAPVHDSIVLIAFQPYSNEPNELTVLALSATVASLYSRGFGRVVVAGENPRTDAWFARQAFYKLTQVLNGKKYQLKPSLLGDRSNVTSLDHIQVAFVWVKWTWSEFVPSNIPKGSLEGFRNAIKGRLVEGETVDWLGADAKRWKYVMLTEPDTLLALKTHLIPEFLRLLDDGYILAPHRLQPIPHEFDFVRKEYNATSRDYMIPAVGNLSNVTELGIIGACCDAGARTPEPIKRLPDMNGCESFWWQCALGNPREKNSTNNSSKGHERILEYYLMNLTHGTGFVLVAGTEHGRKCIPQPPGIAICPPSEEKIAWVNEPSNREIELALETLEEQGISEPSHPVRIRRAFNRSRSDVPAPRFIDQSLLGYKDMFSACWWQSIDSFLEVDLSTITDVEGAFFRQFYTRESRVKLTVNFLDMAVEHLSNWWQAAYKHRSWTLFPGRYDLLLAKLKKYIESHMQVATPLHDSIALIAFEPYKKEPKELTVASLSATIASLYCQGFGRIVVVGKNRTQEFWYSHQAMLKLNQVLQGNQYDPSPGGGSSSIIRVLNQTEVSFVEAFDPMNSDDSSSIPKGALQGFRHALNGELNPSEIKRWLGRDVARWNYVLLVELDSLLTFKPGLGPAFLDAMDDGFILVPHRLQPIPHEFDFISDTSTNRGAIIPAVGNFTNVTELSGACCDAGALPESSREANIDGCDNFWWICALGNDMDPPDVPNNSTLGHEILFDFHLMNLTYGTGFVLVAGTEHGRKCTPQPYGHEVCNE